MVNNAAESYDDWLFQDDFLKRKHYGQEVTKTKNEGSGGALGHLN